jgi:antirestriction protein
MQTTANTTPRVYVGTYGKYNRGSLGGSWVDLERFAGDRDAFLAYCAEIHKDEHEPEFMFQDFEGFPREFYGESNLPERLFEWLELDEEEREILAAYIDATNDDTADLRDARDHYVGTYASGAEFAQECADGLEHGMTKSVPGWLWNCIDWERAWECELRFDYTTSEREGGLYIFHN